MSIPNLDEATVRSCEVKCERPVILFVTCGGSLERIKALLLNRNADEYCQSAASRALVYAVVEGVVPREQVLALFGSLFTGNEADPDSDFWAFVASSVCDLYPKELMPVIKKAFADGLIYTGFIFFTHPLVGRGRELAWMEGVMESVLTGAGQILRLEGEAGLGKSHFMISMTAISLFIHPKRPLPWRHTGDLGGCYEHQISALQRPR